MKINEHPQLLMIVLERLQQQEMRGEQTPIVMVTKSVNFT